MVKTKEEKIKEKQDANRTYPVTTGFAKLQDKIAELEVRIEELEAKE